MAGVETIYIESTMMENSLRYERNIVDENGVNAEEGPDVETNGELLYDDRAEEHFVKTKIDHENYRIKVSSEPVKLIVPAENVEDEKDTVVKTLCAVDRTPPASQTALVQTKDEISQKNHEAYGLHPKKGKKRKKQHHTDSIVYVGKKNNDIQDDDSQNIAISDEDREFYEKNAQVKSLLEVFCEKYPEYQNVLLRCKEHPFDCDYVRWNDVVSGSIDGTVVDIIEMSWHLSNCSLGQCCLFQSCHNYRHDVLKLLTPLSLLKGILPVMFGMEIGSGGVSTVHAILTSINGNKTSIVIKKAKKVRTSEELELLRRKVTSSETGILDKVQHLMLPFVLHKAWPMYLADCSLGDYIKERGKAFSSEACLSIVNDTASGLAYLHSKLLIHRDVKSQNVMLCWITEDTFIAKLGDFDFLCTTEKNERMKLKGTRGHVSHEVYEDLYRDIDGALCSREFSPKSDMFAITIVVQQMISGWLCMFKISKKQQILKAVVRFMMEEEHRQSIDGYYKELYKFYKSHRPTPQTNDSYTKLYDAFESCINEMDSSSGDSDMEDTCNRVFDGILHCCKDENEGHSEYFFGFYLALLVCIRYESVKEILGISANDFVQPRTANELLFDCFERCLHYQPQNRVPADVLKKILTENYNLWKDYGQAQMKYSQLKLPPDEANEKGWRTKKCLEKQLFRLMRMMRLC